jgi:hypothetical protein
MVEMVGKVLKYYDRPKKQNLLTLLQLKPPY